MPEQLKTRESKISCFFRTFISLFYCNHIIFQSLVKFFLLGQYLKYCCQYYSFHQWHSCVEKDCIISSLTPGLKALATFIQWLLMAITQCQAPQVLVELLPPQKYSAGALLARNNVLFPILFLPRKGSQN